ncbi:MULTISPECIES: dihydroorotase [Archaeoglobus]|jgi:dihydroorotase|uniref:Dihydroorotase n=3 Tax=Archaeoglobus fulgidus TaxID=2234 RepID=PYRC_ARCFU|nr:MULTISPECIES: dihydroorotase [Archaeoglobus]O28034.1 RecName: Full=Dihydroorotase; Short=DHOase [Archaeoglobus fulgidus DSM 4304]AAB89007.1 dihydroorotase (pyrC) [Archaeoglobus fulgidus DSM 4304]AIG99257.1 Dihydroorotase [Archaeoglobus fulgidus DSM 8774]KUJ93256.1 MAG: Dihydroorotase [Archaeoglobus fulgidus]KUK06926.1 MAG: Dihydroorotase [Archaeoglobus fulgidus]MDI3497418.1 dihydroorotase [Archaeoglobus sp.]
MIRGKVFYKGEFVEAGIEVENGRIKRIGKLVEGKEVKGVILPAGIDVHVHLRDFAEKRKETIETGTLSALHGGICLVVDQPNTKPPVDDAETYFRRMGKAEKSVYVDYALNLALTNSNHGKIGSIMRKISERYFVPAVGEVFIQHDSEDLQIDYETLSSVYKRFEGVVFTIHAEDPAYVARGSPNFVFRRREAEVLAVERLVELGKFHFCHISTKDSAKEILNSNSTYEVTPHHMLLSVEDYGRLGNLVNVNPPLREREDVEWLFRNFHRIDVLASDHAPHTLEDKEAGASGFPGVETMYPLFVNLASKGYISFKTLVEKIASNPARIFGFKGYGEIEVGNYANFAVFDLKKVDEIRAERLHSKCGWTPFEGFEAVFPDKVYLRGKELLENEMKAGNVLKKRV